MTDLNEISRFLIHLTNFHVFWASFIIFFIVFRWFRRRIFLINRFLFANAFFFIELTFFRCLIQRDRRVEFRTCRTTRLDSILELNKNFCSTLGFEQKFLFKPEKFVCDELGFFEFGLFKPGIELTNLFNPRVGFELLSETQFYDQASSISRFFDFWMFFTNLCEFNLRWFWSLCSRCWSSK
jgi:hypothetical protein